MDQTPPFGPRLRALRRAKVLSLSDLAAQTGVSEATLSRIETGLTQVSAPHLYGLAAQLGVDISSFFRPPPASSCTDEYSNVLFLP